MRRRFFLIFNPLAGIAGVPLVDEVVAALSKSGAKVIKASSPDIMGAQTEARAAVDRGSCEAVIAAGGDGTVRMAAAALIGCAVPLGLIPAGTANVLAHEIGLSPDPSTVARALLHGPEIKVACARANGEPFLLMTGAGFDARVVGALDQRWKCRVGKLAYAPPVLGALVRPPDRLQVIVDGRSYGASWAVITNARHYAGRFVLARTAAIERRGLQAILFRAGNPGTLTAQLLSLVLGRLDARAARGRDVEMLPCSRVSIASAHPVPVQVDGDAFGTTPLEVDAGCESVRLITPCA